MRSSKLNPAGSLYPEKDANAPKNHRLKTEVRKSGKQCVFESSGLDNTRTRVNCG